MRKWSGPTEWQKTRFAVLRRDKFTCRYCGTKGTSKTLHVDHVVPRSKGGADTMDNLVTACIDCNEGKAAEMLRADEVIALRAAGKTPKPKAVRDVSIAEIELEMRSIQGRLEAGGDSTVTIDSLLRRKVELKRMAEAQREGLWRAPSGPTGFVVERILRRVAIERGALHGFLQEAKWIEIDGRKLAISFDDRASFFREKLRQPETSGYLYRAAVAEAPFIQSLEIE